MSSATVNPSFYADFQGLTSLKKDVKAQEPQAIVAAAKQFESLFTDMMLKSMRAAKLGKGLGDSDESDFYQDMYDQQLSLQMAQGKGLGLADMLVQQLTRRNASQSASKSPAKGAAAVQSPAAIPATASPATTNSRKSSGAVSDRQRISFIQQLEPYAQRAATQLGVSADGLIAQAALETGWGQHVPSGRSGAGHNLFGIKAGSSWSGASLSAQTTEYQQNVASNLPQSFRAYASVQQGVNDYVTLLRRQPGYQAALGTGEDVKAFASALQRGGYASDPDYAQKLVATSASVKALRASAAHSTLEAGAAQPILKLQAGEPISSGEESA